MAERVDLERYADDFGYHLDRAEPGSALEECARWGLALVAKLRAAHEVIESARVGFPLIWKGDIRRSALAALDAYDQATGRPDPAAGHAEPESEP